MSTEAQAALPGSRMLAMLCYALVAGTFFLAYRHELHLRAPATPEIMGILIVCFVGMFYTIRSLLQMLSDASTLAFRFVLFLVGCALAFGFVNMFFYQTRSWAASGTPLAVIYFGIFAIVFQACTVLSQQFAIRHPATARKFYLV